MSMWDPRRVKAQFRLCAQQLGQIRDRKDAEGHIVGRDITTLLQQGNVMLARAKAQKLIHDDVLGDVLEILEMQIGVLLERFGELDSGSPGPAIIEAAATIVYAAPQIGIKDLQGVRDLLGHQLGLEFVRSSTTNRDSHVSPKVIQALSAPPVSASDMNSYLMNIAKSYGYKWAPEFMPDEILNVISELLDKTNDSPVVDMPRLRSVCAHGIPDDPCWLRPRTWRLLLGTLPVLKASWDNDARKQRENYYDLVRRLLDPYTSLPPPTEPLGPLDASLMEAIKDLFRVPPNLFAGLEEEPESFMSCPVDVTASEDIKISCAYALDHRLQLIHGRDADGSPQTTPEIRIQDDTDSSTEISATSPNSIVSAGLNRPKTLYPSKAFNTAGAHPKHATALVRLLYIHSCLNPAHKSPHMASLLIPLYSVLNQEIESQDLAHVEADTFWAFEAMVSEFAELEDEDGGDQWMQKFSQRLQWADAELYNDMNTKGLDPSLPHYSYRWLAPVLTHTLPLQAVLSVWDALFSRPMATRDSCPKLEHLIDVCTSMLLRAKAPIMSLGKSAHRSSGLWGEENIDSPPLSPVRRWELSDAFIEGMALLQLYPVAAAGGIESILLTAAELSSRREVEAARPKANESLGNRLRDTVWRGFTNQVASPLPSPDTSDSEEGSLEDSVVIPLPSPQAAQSPNLTARLAGAVWKGITNQSAMEVPYSPLSPSSPLSPPLPSSVTNPSPAAPSPSLSTSSLWSYAERLKDSDAAATLAKVSTNWRVRAIQAWSNTNAADQLPHENPSWSVAAKPRSGSFSTSDSQPMEAEARRTSLPGLDRSGVYSPPARPAFFRPPRDSMLPQPRRSPLASPSLPESPNATASAPGRRIRESIASIAGFSPAPKTSKAGPRPLLLSTSSLITGVVPSPSPSSARFSVPSHMAREQQSSDLRRRPTSRHRDSQSSVSSIGSRTPHKMGTRSDVESDAMDSRRIPLHRGSISPIAPTSRIGNSRPTSQSSASDRGTVSPSGGSQTISIRAKHYQNSRKGWGRVDMPDSPSTLPSSPPPPTPPSLTISPGGNEVSSGLYRRGSALNDPSVRALDLSSETRRYARKKTAPLSLQLNEASDSSASVDSPAKVSRVRSKRHANTPTNLRIQKSDSQSSGGTEHNTPSPQGLALPEWSEDHDSTTTPRATTFDGAHSESEDDHQLSSGPQASPRSPRRIRKISNEASMETSRTRKEAHQDGARSRKSSTDGQSTRSRKTSADNRNHKRVRDSAAEEGDDEGYDDLLSAYESEDSVAHHHSR
ncbi:hypothetical protein DENSPDRAFT_821369 [Dentipellis sp. KUC8613]|nr:hypothetical protein DENSPDRAFT_821369 [Dentipellis sp. KUC8613]